MHWLVADIGGTNTRCAVARPGEAVLAIAAPIDGDEIRMININWISPISGCQHERL